MTEDAKYAHRGTGSISRASRRKIQGLKPEKREEFNSQKRKQKRLEARMRKFRRRNPDKRYKIEGGNIIIVK